MIVKEVSLRDNKIADLERRVGALEQNVKMLSECPPSMGRNSKNENPGPPDLSLDIGSVFVTELGVHVLLRSPLDRLSDFYDWKSVPFGISALRTLVSGEDATVLWKLSNQLGLSSAEMDLLDLEFVDSSPAQKSKSKIIDMIRTDTDKLMAWSMNLADRCPIREVSDTLRSLPSMSSAEVDRYVERFLQ
jgi:hypothetical protein